MSQSTVPPVAVHHDTPATDPFAPRHRPVALAVAGLLVVLTVLLEVPALREVVPHGLLGWMRRNSEAWVAAALLLVDLWWIPRELSSRRWLAWWGVLVACAVLIMEVAPGMGASDRIITLQESFVGVAVLSPLLRWGRLGVRRQTVMAVAAALTSLAVAVAASTRVWGSAVGQVVVDQAETVALAVLVIALVIGVHRWPVSAGRAWLRVAYLAVLVVAPIGFALVHRVEPGGVRFAQRTTESFLAALLVGLVIEAVLLRRSPEGEVSPAPLGSRRRGTAAG